MKSLHCPHCALCKHEWPSHDSVSSGYMMSHRSVHGFWKASSSRARVGAPSALTSVACMRELDGGQEARHEGAAHLLG